MTGIPDHNVVQEISPFNSPTERAPVVLIPCLAFAHQDLDSYTPKQKPRRNKSEIRHATVKWEPNWVPAG